MGLKWNILRFLAMRVIEVGVVLVIVMFLPNLPPYTTYEKSYKVTPAKPLEGVLALNEKLNNVEQWHLSDFKGPEAFAVYNGELYTSLDSGDIVKLTGDKHVTPVVKFGKPCKHGYEAKTCGRPLGITFDKNGNLYAADAYYGIFKVNIDTGEKVQLVSPEIEINGKVSKLFNNIAVSSSGDIYWTDSSTDFTLEDGAYDILADGSGRLVRYDPKTKQNKVLIDQLHFGNGLALSENEDFLLISETGRSRVHRYYLKGPKAGTHDLFMDGLPGQPDNLTPDGHGGFFVPLYMTHGEMFPNPAQIFGPFPWMRRLISRLIALFELVFVSTDRLYPNEYSKMGMHLVGNFETVNFIAYFRHSTVLRVNDKGEIIDSYHCTNKRIYTISEAFIYKDHLLLGSPFNEFVGRVPLADLGIKTRVAREAPPTKKVETPPPTQKPLVKPTQKVETPKPTQKVETPKPTQKVETPKPTQKVETPKPTQKVETPKPTQKVETPKPTQAPPKVEPSKAPPTQKPNVQTPPLSQQAKVVTPKPAQKVETPKPAVKVETPKPAVKVETPKPAVKVETPKPAVKVETPKPAVKVESPKPAVKVETPKPAVKVETPKPAGKVETPKPAVKVETPKPAQKVEAPKPVKVEAAKEVPKMQAESKKPVEAAKSAPPPPKVPQTPPASAKAPAGKVPANEKPNPRQ